MTSLDNPYHPEDDNWPDVSEGDYWWHDMEAEMAPKIDPLMEALDDESLWCQYASDPFDMDTWPVFHVFMKCKGWVWDPDKQKAVLSIWNEAWYTRAPSPDEADKAPRQMAELQGWDVLSSDYAYVPKEDHA